MTVTINKLFGIYKEVAIYMQVGEAGYSERQTAWFVISTLLDAPVSFSEREDLR
jgi:hypothetical protein